MTKAEIRVAIAKDAIKQIKAGNIKVSPERYLKILDKETLEVSQNFFKKNIPCMVCQIGQAIVCGINLFNQTTAEENIMNYEVAMKLVKRWFTPKMAVMMEGAFMPRECGWLTQIYVKVTPKEKESVRHFCSMYSDDTSRSLAIWKNVVKNNGNFVPPKVS